MFLVAIIIEMSIIAPPVMHVMFMKVSMLGKKHVIGARMNVPVKKMVVPIIRSASAMLAR